MALKRLIKMFENSEKLARKILKVGTAEATIGNVELLGSWAHDVTKSINDRLDFGIKNHRTINRTWRISSYLWSN